MTAGQIEGLVDEFRATGFGRTEADARRAAFTALTWAAGWSTARMGRFLGVSRARIGQRVEKLKVWAQDPDMPTLRRVMAKERKVEPAWLADMPVAFPADNWQDDSFSGGILSLLSSDQKPLTA